MDVAQLLARARRRIAPRGDKFLPRPEERSQAAKINARHFEWSIISSADDLRPQPTPELIRLVLKAADRALDFRLSEVAARCQTPVESGWVDQWPGEHYRLLAALTEVTETTTAVEVGTFQGPGALSLLAGMPMGRVVTYDIVPWRQIDGTLFHESDFGDRLEQRIGDLADTAYFRSQLETLRRADLLFVDGPKDGVFEQKFLPALLNQLRDRRRIVVIDDIRLLNMVSLWRELPCTKFDATSVGHWSGTGIAFTA